MAAQGNYAGQLNINLTFVQRPNKGLARVGELPGEACAPMPVKKCDHCKTTCTPCWRPEKSLNMLLCNACSLWWKSKRSLKPLLGFDPPSERGAQLALTGVRGVGPVSTEDLTPESSLDSLDGGQRGKRRRRARDWGDDIELYDGHDEEWNDEWTAGSDPDEPVMSVEEAAAILNKFKLAKQPRRATRQTSESPPTYKQTRQGCVKVTVSVTRKAAAPKRGNKNKTCVNCGTTETPTWRRAGGQFPLCNACGVYRTTHGTDRAKPNPVPLQAITRPKLDAAPAFEMPDPPLRTAVIEADFPDQLLSTAPMQLCAPQPAQNYQIANLDLNPLAGLYASPAAPRVMPASLALKKDPKAGPGRLLFPTGPKDVLKVHVQAFAQATRQ